jgi:transcriptional regulator with XRE-family HTH domain
MNRRLVSFDGKNSPVVKDGGDTIGSGQPPDFGKYCDGADSTAILEGQKPQSALILFVKMSSSNLDKRLVWPDGARIVQLRRSLGLSQNLLTEKTKQSKRTIERAEAGRLVYVSTIGYIAVALGVSPSELMKSAEQTPNPRSKRPFVFISYAHADALFVNGFAERLEKAGIPHFRDVKSIPWGGDIPESVHRALEEASHLVVLISPASAQSQWVPYEMGYAKGRSVVLIPYLLHPSMPLPSFISSRRYLSSSEDEAKFITSLQEDMKRFLLAPGAPPSTSH